jgi:ribosome-associated protein
MPPKKTTARRPAPPPPPPQPASARLAAQARAALEDRKGENLKVLDVRAFSTLADYMVLVSGSSAPHLKALANEVIRALKDEGHYCYRKSGLPDDGWLVLDYVDIVIHIFRTDLRSYYALEELWVDAVPME